MREGDYGAVGQYDRTQATQHLPSIHCSRNQINTVECTRVNGIVVFANCAAVNLNGAWKRDDKAIGGEVEGEKEREGRAGDHQGT